ncbi:MAG: ABC transporter permease [Candidatus Odinarchaeota archaeon]
MLYQSSIEKERVIPSRVSQYPVLLELFFLKVLKDRKTYILLLIGILPVAVLLFSPSNDTLWIGSYIDTFTPGEIASLVHLPLISLVLGISAVADEKESKTISQFFSRPVRRDDIVISKWIVSIITGIVMITVINVIYFLVNALLSNDSSFVTKNLDIMIGMTFFLWIYLTTYISLFLLLGVIIEKNAMMMGIFIAYFEVFLGQFIFGLGSGFRAGTPYSITNHIYYIASEYLVPRYFRYYVTNYEPYMSVLVIAGIIVASLIAAIIVIRRKDL